MASNHDMAKYFRHLIGVGSLIRFLNENAKNGLGASIKEHIVTFDDALSKRFLVGLPKKMKSSGNIAPFLGIPYEYRKWCEDTAWKRTVFKEKDRRIYLVTEYVPGDGETFPDIPQFAVAITTDTVKKASLLFKNGKLEGRSFWFDEDGEIGIDMHKSLFSVSAKKIGEKDPIFEREDKTTGKTMYELMREKSQREDRYQAPD